MKQSFWQLDCHTVKTTYCFYGTRTFAVGCQWTLSSGKSVHSLTTCTSSPCSFPPSQPHDYISICSSHFSHGYFMSHLPGHSSFNDLNNSSCAAQFCSYSYSFLNSLNSPQNFTRNAETKHTDGRCLSLVTKIEVPVECSGNKDVSKLWNQSLDSAPESNLYNFTQPVAVTSFLREQYCKHSHCIH